MLFLNNKIRHARTPISIHEYKKGMHTYQWTSILYYLATPSIGALTYDSSNRGITLVCQTQGSPPSNITWYRDGTPLDINGNTTDMAVTVTDRQNSEFNITLNICDSPDAIVGTYKCEVRNRLGYHHASTTLEGTCWIFMNGSLSHAYSYLGLQVSCDQSGFVIGETVTCSCSSDILYTSLSWYQGNTTSSSISSGVDDSNITILVTTDTYGDVHTCRMSTPCGNQEDSFTVNFAGACM